MKILIRLARRFKNIICSSKGETLMESIASLLVLSILLLAVTLMIKTALRMTSTSTQSARAIQENTVNPMMLSELSATDDASITFSYTPGGISTSHDVQFSSDDGIIAFTPPEE